MSKKVSFQPKGKPLFNNNGNAPRPNPTATSNRKPPPRLAPLLIGGGLLYVTATYVSMAVFKSKSDTEKRMREPSSANEKDKTVDTEKEDVDTGSVWSNLAKDYDKEIGMDETVMGIGLMRRWLIGQAKGHVLEVSTGTGRNFQYYKPDQIESATFTDRNPTMLQVAERKFEAYRDRFRQAFFRQANVEDEAVSTYDTVVDTFGLCSCSDPEEALISMAKACKPSPESRILLLEHGRSHYDWLNRILDTNVEKHVHRWGCWWNRDLMGLFERERVKENLEIVKVYRWHFGTTCYIVAKPKLSTAE